MAAPIRIANCSGFYGDRLSAAREMVEGGPIDVLTGDYLAELTMAILWRRRAKSASGGYATSFLRQMEEVMGTCLDRGIRVVANAGGLDPRGLAEGVEELADRLGLAPSVGIVEGDDILGRLPAYEAAGNALVNLDTGVPFAGVGSQALTANAYLGSWAIAEGLARGADLVVTGRVTDAALVVGPAAWWHGWAPDDWDRLAGAVVAGHVIECGAQCTGGNYSFFEEVPGLHHVGFPIAEVAGDGSSVITKHPGTGGRVSVGTVTAQLLYEIAGPRYPSPDATARFDTIRLVEEATDRVRIDGVRGEPPPPTVKVALNYLGGYRNSVGFLVPGPDTSAKVEVALAGLWEATGGPEVFDEVDVQVLGREVDDPADNAEALVEVRVTVKSTDPNQVGRAFSSRAVEMALASYPGFALTGPPGDARPYAVYWPTAVPADTVVPTVTVGGETVEVPAVPAPAFEIPDPQAEAEPAAVPAGPARPAPLGRIAGARSGDKGGNANVGVWVTEKARYVWLRDHLTVERFKELLPESAALVVRRHEFPNLLALNFVVEGLLGEGVASSTRLDPQAKTLGEYLRAKWVPIPVTLLEAGPDGSDGTAVP